MQFLKKKKRAGVKAEGGALLYHHSFPGLLSSLAQTQGKHVAIRQNKL